MTFLLKPQKLVNTLILAGILTAASLAATAQTLVPAAPAGAAAPANAGQHARGYSHTPEKMQTRMARHQAELKAKLALTPAQEAAWSTYTAALQPQARSAAAQPDRAAMRAEFEKLTTPQRIDKMNAFRAKRMDEMNLVMRQRGDATKIFYTELNADQQKVFDAQPMGHSDNVRSGHHGRYGHHRG